MKKDVESILVGDNLSGRLKFLAKDSFVYGGSIALNAILMLITIPLLTKNFSVEAFGVVDFFITLTTLMSVLIVFGQDSAVARYFYDRTDINYRKQVVSQSFLIQVIWLFLVIPCLVLFSDVLLREFISNNETSYIFNLIILQAPFLMLVNYAQNILKWTFQRNRFLVVSLGSNVLIALSLFFAVYFRDASISNVFEIYLFIRVIFGLVGLYFVRSWLTFPSVVSKPIWWPMTAFAFPFGVISISNYFMPLMERTLILQYLEADKLGLYALGVKIALIIAVPIQAFQVAWGPFSLSIHRGPKSSDTYNWVLKTFVVLICALVMLVGLSSEWVVMFMSKDSYIGAASIVPIVALGAAIHGVCGITGIGISLSKKSHLKLFGYISSFIISVLLILLFIEPYGLEGVAWAVVIGRIINCLIETGLAQKAYPLNWEYKGVVMVILLCLLVVSSATYIDDKALEQSVYFTGVLCVPLIGWLFLLSASERGAIKASLKRDA